jgi:hypothetical protein
MTTATNVVEVPIPAGMSPTADDLEVLERLFRVMTCVRLDPGREWSRVRNTLERNGWTLSWGLEWHVEARRGRELEQACGTTLDEAFARVWQVTREDQSLEGTP